MGKIVSCSTYSNSTKADPGLGDGYKFKKTPSARCPADNWELMAIKEGWSNPSPIQKSFIEGNPSTFKHRRTGNSYAKSKGRK